METWYLAKPYVHWIHLIDTYFLNVPESNIDNADIQDHLKNKDVLEKFKEEFILSQKEKNVKEKVKTKNTNCMLCITNTHHQKRHVI